MTRRTETGVVDRYSLGDKQIYGAEDDEDMDAILAAIDKASEEADEPDNVSN